MSNTFNLAAYLARIGYSGPCSPNPEMLRAIHSLHPDAIPFENLDPLLGRPVSLDLSGLQEKLITQRRGGYCFEQNTLLAAALEAIGFRVITLAARVVWRAQDTARTHMLLLVDAGLEGTYIADVGFGGFLLDAPLELTTDRVQQTKGGVWRIVEVESEFLLQVKLLLGWRDVYRFGLERHLPADYEVANWFTSTHPTSPFTTNLLAERLTPERRVSICNDRVTERLASGGEVTRTLSNAEELADALKEMFRLSLPATPRQIWDRFTRTRAEVL
jgi:N-hydroxyarylamine O-acetyltransferase